MLMFHSRKLLVSKKKIAVTVYLYKAELRDLLSSKNRNVFPPNASSPCQSTGVLNV